MAFISLKSAELRGILEYKWKNRKRESVFQAEETERTRVGSLCRSPFVNAYLNQYLSDM